VISGKRLIRQRTRQTQVTLSSDILSGPGRAVGKHFANSGLIPQPAIETIRVCSSSVDTPLLVAQQLAVLSAAGSIRRRDWGPTFPISGHKPSSFALETSRTAKVMRPCD
jgi:hypothetical protein